MFKKLADTYHLHRCQQQKLVDFLTLLEKWNKTHNLTAIRNVNDMIIYHLWDSLSIMPYITGDRILDLGAGAGLPGIPLAIAYPNKTFVLLDSHAKKVCFCREFLARAKLDNVTVVQARAESWQADQCFDHVVTRAFGTICSILKLATHLCCPSGSFLVMKAAIPSLELDDMPLGFAYQIYPLSVPGLRDRHLIAINRRTDINHQMVLK